MNPNIAIRAENISKQYRLGEVGTGTISHDLNRAWARLRGREDPFLKIGESNDRSTKGESDYVWSLKDINFEIEKGEAVGIIGRNGAGKSTLLKLLSRVTKPTTGHFEVQGRIASLLEVGTGFNPEMTGRENIFLNGAILGMRRNEIKRKFDEIVDFAGVERYIDTPVKRYSSGMYVRLAFAVAAHLESEILIVDEVLAVGDAEFQKKCLGKMGDVSKGEGRTVLFVSHNMAAVRNLCETSIVLDKGKIVYTGRTENAMDFYTNLDREIESKIYWDKHNAPGNDYGRLTSIEATSSVFDFYIEEEICIETTFENLVDGQTLNISISLFDSDDVYILSSPNLNRIKYKCGKFKSKCVIPKNLLNTGRYYVTVLLVGDNFQILAQVDKVIAFDVNELGLNRGEYFGAWKGSVRPILTWTNEEVTA